MPKFQYEYDKLMHESSEELLRRLAVLWGSGIASSIDVWGRVLKGHDSSRLVMVDFRSCNTNQHLSYPSTDRNETPEQWISLQGCSTSLEEGEYIRISTSLAGKDERERLKNPFALKIEGEPTKFRELPKELATKLTTSLESYSTGATKLINEVATEYFEFISQDQKKKLSSQISQLKEELNDQEEALSKGEEELQKQKQDKLQIIKTNYALRAERDLIAKELAVKEEAMVKAKEELKKYADALRGLDLISQEQYDKLIGKKQPPPRQGVAFDGGDYKKAVDHIQSYIYNKHQYFYNINILRDFLALIETNDLIVLAGDSGSGKTSLCRNFADAVGGVAHVIPVKPNWTSREDLLGYYNPIDNRYIKTEFLGALLDAKNDSTRLHVICLDEMNIARVEYYFADFLSSLEERARTPKINLLDTNREESDTNAEEIKTYLDLISEVETKYKRSFPELLKITSTEEHLSEEMRQKIDHIKYHYDIRKKLAGILGIDDFSILLPQNVRVVGTINVDETTHYLSPKVLDRTHVIKIKNQWMNFLDSKEELTAGIDNTVSEPILFTPAQLGDRKPYPEPKNDDQLVIFLRKLNDYLIGLGIDFGWRSLRQSLQYRDIMENLFQEDFSIIASNILLHKVFPKLVLGGQDHYGEEGDRNVYRLKEMKNFLDGELKNLDGQENSCISELDSLIKMAEKDGQVNYWNQ